LNGQSLGKKEMPCNSHLRWNVKYAPGILSAKGYNDGKVVVEAKVETTGAPAAIKLTPDRATIHGDGEDCSVVTVAVTDSQGRVVPVVNNLIRFQIKGSGKIIGVGNGNPICHEADVYVNRPSVRYLVLEDWRMKKVSGPENRPETAADFDENQWQRVDVSAASGPLKEGESAVYRTHFSLINSELAAARITVNFGMIDDAGWIYVNGRRAGRSHDWHLDPSFDIGQFLHAGSNTLAVVVKNGDGDGGINKGVMVDVENPPPPADWQRSVFNGLAQVIVEAGKEAGEIKLTASADGLAPTTLTIHAEASPGRPAVP
jgi:beta-galactosidase